MLRLDPQTGPKWIDLGLDVRVEVRPLTSALLAAAQLEPDVADMPEGTPNEARFAALARAVARLTILQWEGVADADGNPAPIDADHVNALLDLVPFGRNFATLYLARAFAVLDEKKG